MSPAPKPAATACHSGRSVTSASVLRIMPATLAAFSSAQRATLAGSIAGLHQIDVLLAEHVEAPAGPGFAAQVLHHDAALEARIRHELAQRLLQRTPEDLSADLLIAIEPQLVHHRRRAH